MSRPVGLCLGVSLLVPAAILTLPAHAECGQDTDWPEWPCYDAGAPSQEEQRKVWAKYYELKGQEWMESKKQEMLQAIQNRTLQQWVLYESTPNDHANFNVYYYYYLNGQAPSINDPKATSSLTVNTGWETGPIGWVTVIALGAAVSGAAIFMFRKSRKVS